MQQTYAKKSTDIKPPLPKSQSDLIRHTAPKQSTTENNTTDDDDDDFLPVKPRPVQRSHTDDVLPSVNVANPPKAKPAAPKSLATVPASSVSVFDFDDVRGADSATAAKRPKISITFASRPSKPRPPSSDEEEQEQEDNVKDERSPTHNNDSDDDVNESTDTEPEDLMPPKPINVPLSPISSRVRTVRSDGTVAFIAQYGKKKSDAGSFTQTKVVTMAIQSYIHLFDIDA